MARCLRRVRGSIRGLGDCVFLFGAHGEVEGAVGVVGSPVSDCHECCLDLVEGGLELLRVPLACPDRVDAGCLHDPVDVAVAEPCAVSTLRGLVEKNFDALQPRIGGVELLLDALSCGGFGGLAHLQEAGSGGVRLSDGSFPRDVVLVGDPVDVDALVDGRGWDGFDLGGVHLGVRIHVSHRNPRSWVGLPSPRTQSRQR